MDNYPQLDDCSGVWTLKEVNNAVMGGYWREAGSRGIFSAGRYSPSDINIIDLSIKYFIHIDIVKNLFH